MSDLNQCTITGRLGVDPEVRRNQEGKAIVNLRVAVSETWRDRNSGDRKEKTEWISAVIFSEGLCKVAEQYLKKGSKVLLQGKISTRKWQVSLSLMISLIQYLIMRRLKMPSAEEFRRFEAQARKDAEDFKWWATQHPSRAKQYEDWSDNRECQAEHYAREASRLERKK